MPDQPVGTRATIYVVAIVLLCIGQLSFVVGITIVRPAADNTALIATSLGFIVPVVGALMAGAVQQVHLAVNSRLTQLLELTATSAKAEGKLSGVLSQQAGQIPPP